MPRALPLVSFNVRLRHWSALGRDFSRPVMLVREVVAKRPAG